MKLIFMPWWYVLVLLGVKNNCLRTLTLSLTVHRLERPTKVSKKRENGVVLSKQY